MAIPTMMGKSGLRPSGRFVRHRGSKAETVIIQHHFSLTRDTSFNQAANALVNAAKVLHFSNRDVDSIRTILGNRGFTITL